MAANAKAAAKPLFHEVVFHIVIGEKLSKAKAQKLRDQLIANGAEEATQSPPPEHPHIAFDLTETTHIIASDIHFPGFEEAQQAMIPVVNPDWVEASIRKRKTAHVRPFTPDPRMFFSGVFVSAAELPEGDKEAIFGGVTALGGQYSVSLTRFVTHIVCLNLDNHKCQQAIEKKLDVKFVLPHWFDDCLKLNRKIDEGPYLLPNPEIELVSADAPITLPVRDDLRFTHRQNITEQIPTVREGFDAFEGKKVKLGADLGINPRLRRVISEIIIDGKGEIVNTVKDADTFVCQFREGKDYRRASRRGLTVGNMLWLYWIFAHGVWTSPLKRLLHYPIVRGGLKGMENFVISVSNYGGDARMYLENLIEATGAKFTKSMKPENTHLITARAQSEKYQAAKDWNINIVNHLWLEESYAKWEIQSMTNQKYTHFPPRTNLMEVVGQTSIDQNALRQFYNTEEESDPEDDEEPVDEEHDITMEDSSPLQKAAATNEATTTEKEVDSTFKTPARKPGRPKTAPSITTPGAATPASRRTQSTSTPASTLSTSSRRAKESAASKLSESISDMNLYEKEKKRKGGVLGTGRKRSLDESFTSISPPPPSAPRKKKPKTKIAHHLLITGYTWSESRPEIASKRRLMDLGIHLLDDDMTTRPTILAAPKLVRTAKFVCAIAAAPLVVTTKWIEDCLDQNKLLDPSSYLLVDSAGEARLGVSLSSALANAKKNKGLLLKGYGIYVAPHVGAGFDTCKKIVEANGGVCVSFKTGKRVNAAADAERLVLVSSEKEGDKKLWKRFLDMGREDGKKAELVSMEWLLDLAMGQEVVWREENLLGRKKK
ncbi:BRCT domain-containing protein [Ascobolus immersus RN42]|uniref:BRCT domain-containing protein n=1 Tax=Ascobolus immersus RN42 TaxID=1160509 RepID=A0A3N4H8N6_ASCIM|nr:BRCT domain-containing protein [Ascobolus immersus RN42]